MISTKLQKTFIFFILFALVCSSISTIGVSQDIDDYENSKIKPIDKIVDSLLFYRLSNAVYTENDIVYLLGVREAHNDKMHRKYIKYNLSSHNSEIVIKKDYGLPVGDSLPAVYTGENIFIFGEEISEKDGSCHATDSIFKFDLEANKLEELDIKLPVNITEENPYYEIESVWVGDKALLFLESGVYSFYPSNYSMKKHEIDYPEEFFSSVQDRSIVYVENDVYLFGKDEIYSFNPHNYTLMTLDTKLPTDHPEAWRRAAVYTGEYVYIMGGGGFSQEIIDEIIRFDPETEEAELLDITLPAKLHGCNLVSNGEYIYIFSGLWDLDVHGSPRANIIWRYNYQDLPTNDDYPGIENKNPDWKMITVTGLVGAAVIVTVGAVVYYRKYR